MLLSFPGLAHAAEVVVGLEDTQVANVACLLALLCKSPFSCTHAHFMAATTWIAHCCRHTPLRAGDSSSADASASAKASASSEGGDAKAKTAAKASAKASGDGELAGLLIILTEF